MRKREGGIMDTERGSGLAVGLVSACSLVMAILVLATVAMLLAAQAFTNGNTIGIPVLVIFDGSRAMVDAPSVHISGSVAGMVVSVLLLALPLPLWFIGLARREQTATSE
jgi:tetrahydromethanopterin S-methyltransferase subunit F